MKDPRKPTRLPALVERYPNSYRLIATPLRSLRAAKAVNAFLRAGVSIDKVAVKFKLKPATIKAKLRMRERVERISKRLGP